MRSLANEFIKEPGYWILKRALDYYHMSGGAFSATGSNINIGLLMDYGVYLLDQQDENDFACVPLT